VICLGLDIGTTTISAVAFDPSARQLVAQATLMNDADCTPSDKKALGWAELDLDRVFAIALAALSQVSYALGPRVADAQRIGVTGQMHGVAFLDEHSVPVRSAITWQDQRAHDVMDEFIARAGGVGAFMDMGCLPATGYLGPTMFWLKKYGALPHARMCFIPDAVVAMLSKRPPITDPTNAAASGVFDIVRHQWSVEMLRKVDISIEMLSPIAEAGAFAGALAADIAYRAGLSNGATVCVALGDHQTSLIGSGADAPDVVHVNVGTSGQVSMVIDHFTPMDAVHGIETRPFPGNRYLLTGAALCGGDAFALLRHFFDETAIMLGQTPPTAQTAYAVMVSAASHIAAGADGLRADTRFDGARRDQSARAKLSGMTRTNFTPAHVARAVLEGIVEELWEFYTAMHAHAGAACMLIGSGNAIRKNPLLAQIVATRFDLPLHVCAWEEEAAVGAAMMAARNLVC
jgi:sugar (pentulose or hexulose) kinase